MKIEPQIGTLIKKRRLELNITMASLAKQIGISRATLSAIENNDINCSFKTVLALVDSLELTLSLTACAKNMKEVRKRATRINTLLSKKINRFIVMSIEMYAQEINENSSEVYKKMNNKGIVEDLKNDYEDLHGMSTEYINQYIDSALRRNV